MKNNCKGARASLPANNKEPDYPYPIILENAGKGARAPLQSSAFFRGWHRRGYIPHLDAPELTQFVTFRLYDTLPAHIIVQWEEEMKLRILLKAGW